jgi:hypothetical protein
MPGPPIFEKGFGESNYGGPLLGYIYGALDLLLNRSIADNYFFSSSYGLFGITYSFLVSLPWNLLYLYSAGLFGLGEFRNLDLMPPNEFSLYLSFYYAG